MRRSERLKVVLEQAQRREDRALQELQRRRQAWEQQQARLESLQEYRQDYQQMMRTGLQGPVPASRLQTMHQFITQIDSALAAQGARVDEACQQFQQAREAWQRAWERREGMARYIEACRAQEQRDEDRREQRLLDEQAAQRHRYRY